MNQIIYNDMIYSEKSTSFHLTEITGFSSSDYSELKSRGMGFFWGASY